MKTLRIFISSPGDVLTERTISKRVIRKLQSEFGTNVHLEALLWEDLPLQANVSFQEGIDMLISPEGVDIAVFILWSRLGSSPGHKYVRPDGMPYRSGTEYEFDIMFEANRKTQGCKPAILAYIKDAEAEVPVECRANTSMIKEWIDQKEASQHFIQERFYDPVSKTVWGAYHQFDSPTTFEGKLTEHLRRLILEKIGHVELIEWEGNPYVGLRSYEENEETVFYGRRRVINEIENQLLSQIKEKSPSLFVLGSSGSGKSSLVKAGLIPDMTKAGIVDKTMMIYRCIMPSQFRGKFYDGIINVFDIVYPMLSERAVWQDLTSGKEVEVSYVLDVLKEVQKEGEVVNMLILFIDQFEELFTDPLITEDEKIKVLRLLNILISTNRLWFIFSMRNDFYEYFTRYPGMASIKAKSIVFDMPQMQLSDIQEVVEEPAHKAGLKWEIDKNGNALNKIIINDISSYQNNLPLVEMALSELFRNKIEENTLTLEAYNRIGRIRGSIVNYANSVFKGLNVEEKSAFEDILSGIITVSSDDSNVYSRKTADKVDLIKSPIHEKVLDTLVNKHLLISNKNEDGKSTITIIHEVLIESWDVIQAWIEKEKQAIRLNNYYETQSTHWSQSNQSKEQLITGKTALNEAEHFLYLWKDKASRKVTEYLMASVKTKMKKGLTIYFIFSLLGLLFLVELLYLILVDSEIFDRIYNDVGLTIHDVAESFYLYIQLVALLIYTTIKKYRSRPIYQRIKGSIFFWGGMTLVSLYDFVKSIIDIIVEEDFASAAIISVYLLIPLFVFLKFVEKIVKYREIEKLWSKGLIHKEIKGNKVMSGLVRASMIIFVPSSLILFLSMWGITLSNKQDKIEESQELIDELFSGLDNLSSTLSVADFYYINNLKKSYIESAFKNEIESGEGEHAETYAIANLNLSRPDSAAFYLGSNHWLRFVINCNLGNNDEAEDALKEIIKSDLGYFSDLPWFSELIGNFSIALSYLESANKNGNIDLRKPDPDLVNYAHALLMTGQIEDALSIYNKYFLSEFPDKRKWKDEMKKDFQTFRWLGFDDHSIRIVESKLELKPIMPYTQPGDTANISLKKMLVGRWECEEGGKRIVWETTMENMTYYTFSDSSGLSGKSFTRYRLANKNGTIYIEEFEFNTGSIMSGIVQVVNNDLLKIVILENDNKDKNRNVRFYRRIKN